MSDRGFTLLELLISVAILGLVAVVIGSSVRLGIRTWERGESGIEASQRLRVLSDRLAQEVKSAYPYIIDVEGEERVAFHGGPDSLWFVTALTGPAEGGLKWVSYSVMDGALTTREGRLPDKRLLEKVGEKGDILDRAVHGFSLEYLSSAGRWEEAWDLREELPRAVKMRIGGGPSFVVTIPAAERPGPTAGKG